jgi:hypothetical protein
MSWNVMGVEVSDVIATIYKELKCHVFYSYRSEYVIFTVIARLRENVGKMKQNISCKPIGTFSLNANVNSKYGTWTRRRRK